MQFFLRRIRIFMIDVVIPYNIMPYDTVKPPSNGCPSATYRLRGIPIDGADPYAKDRARGTGGNRGVPSVREGHGTDAVGLRRPSRPRINRILSRIVPPAYRYCARTRPRV